MITWAEFTFPPLNLYNVWPNNYKEWYNMSGGIESMYEDERAKNEVEYKYQIINKDTPFEVTVDYLKKLQASKEKPKELNTSPTQVIKDLCNREMFGKAKYGKELTANTDEDMLNHLYNELLDGAVYIRTLISQRKTPKYNPML